MTVTDPVAASPVVVPEPFAPVAIDLYRDIHKGIRAELFGAVLDAGSLDPADDADRAAVATQVGGLVDLLASHAEHEDAVIQPVLVGELPALAEQIEGEHHALEGRIVGLRVLADEAAAAPAVDRRHTSYRLYVELASFTGAYLAHQDVEERVVMPALEAAVGVEACLGLHQAIVGSIPPDEMAQSLAFMIPAMNVEDRTELLGGMQAGAPPEVFEQVLGLVRSVLPAAEHKELARRLGVD